MLPRQTHLKQASFAGRELPPMIGGMWGQAAYIRSNLGEICVKAVFASKMLKNV